MAKTDFDFQKTRTVPTATDINSPFKQLEDNTDGTAGKIEGENVRSEGITRDHLSDKSGANSGRVHNATRSKLGSSVTISTTSFSDVHSTGYSTTLTGNRDMLRIEFNPFATITAYTGSGSTPDDKNAAQYYLAIFATIGGADVRISPIFGYGTITDGRGFTGSRSETTTFYTRNPISFIYIPTANTTITDIVLKGRVDNGTNCTVKFENRWAFLIEPNY